jgi:hypothetical protein
LYTQPEMLLAAAQGSQLVMAARCESRSISARVGRILANGLSGWRLLLQQLAWPHWLHGRETIYRTLL